MTRDDIIKMAREAGFMDADKNVVRISISKPNQVIPTTVQGQVVGIRFWRVDEIAIELDAIS